MARAEKVAEVTEVRDRMQDATATMLTEYRGLTVGQLADLRRELRKAGAEYRVVKNTLTKIAVRDAGFDIPDELLTGPTAVTFCGDDPVAAAKALRAFAKTNPALVVKGGILEGRFIDAGEAIRLADLASREELLARLAGLMQAILAQPARLALANLTKAARLLAALQEKRQAAGEVVDSGQTASGAAVAESAEDDVPADAPTVAETPAPDTAAAEAVTEAAAETEGVDATAGATGPEGPAANTEPERAAETPAGDDATDQADVDAAAEGGTPPTGAEG